MTDEERIAALESTVRQLWQAVIRLAALTARHVGVPEEEIDQVFLEEYTKGMKDKGEI
jgi:hypothetical protein